MTYKVPFVLFEFTKPVDFPKLRSQAFEKCKFLYNT